VLAISVLSLAGVPPFPGFFGKYFLFTAVFEKYPALVVLAVINSAISIYYYFKVIIAAYFHKGSESDTAVVIPGEIRLTVACGTDTHCCSVCSAVSCLHIIFPPLITTDQTAMKTTLNLLLFCLTGTFASCGASSENTPVTPQEMATSGQQSGCPSLLLRRYIYM
jgi:NADH:ubiquinone oxidoreductase subunit 2 (subunit N)